VYMSAVVVLILCLHLIGFNGITVGIVGLCAWGVVIAISLALRFTNGESLDF